MKYYIDKNGRLQRDLGGQYPAVTFCYRTGGGGEYGGIPCSAECPLFDVERRKYTFNEQVAGLYVNLHCGGGTRSILIERDERDPAPDPVKTEDDRLAERNEQGTEAIMVARMKSAVSNIICQSFNFGNVESKMKEEELNKRANEGVDEIVKAIKGV